MKSKVVTVLIFLFLSYILPLLGNFSLILMPQIFVLVLISIIIFITQPALTMQDTKQNKSRDKHSVFAILISLIVCQIISVMEWAYFKSAHDFEFDITTSISLFLLVGGTVFRVWCIKTLGKYFTATVQTQANQKVITLGAYSVVRHPSYLGAYLAIVGSSVLLHAYIGIMFSTVIMFVAYWYRIKVEEETLVREFGEEYKSYQARTKKIFPYIY